MALASQKLGQKNGKMKGGGSNAQLIKSITSNSAPKLQVQSLSSYQLLYSCYIHNIYSYP